MTDYISREAALNFEMEIEADPEEIQAILKGMAIMSEHIKALPVADVVERKRGKWRRNMFGGELLSYSCSECGEHLPYRYNTDFCPSCGAQMEPCENRNKVERTMYPPKDGAE